MEQSVQHEINTIKGMVCNWYKFYLGCADGHKYDQIHVEEFDEIVSTNLMPYLRRLQDCRYITPIDVGEICSWIGNKHLELEKAISEVKPKKPDDSIVILLKKLDLTETQKKAVISYLKGK